jgi:hypothetical protein
MIVLLPTSDTQTISIMPRFEPYFYRVEDDGGTLIQSTCLYSDIAITITRDGDGESETIYPLSISRSGYYIDLSISSTILDESSTYRVEMVYYSDLWYRDKIYVTSQSDYTIKHQLAQPSYTQYDTIDDNTYIIR